MVCSIDAELGELLFLNICDFYDIYEMSYHILESII